MGLFDKKKKGRDDFGSPVEQIDLDAADSALLEESAIEPEEPEPAPAARAEARRPAYGIEDAIALMRTLPTENVELVVQVVKHTLESAHIDVAAILDDAAGKQEGIEARIAVLRGTIAEHEREIASRRTEIAQLEEEHRETTRVVERLALARKLADRGRADTVIDPASESANPPEPADGSRTRAAEPPPPPRGKPASRPPPTPAGGTPVLGAPKK